MKRIQYILIVVLLSIGSTEAYSQVESFLCRNISVIDNAILQKTGIIIGHNVYDAYTFQYIGSAFTAATSSDIIKELIVNYGTFTTPEGIALNMSFRDAFHKAADTLTVSFKYGERLFFVTPSEWIIEFDNTNLLLATGYVEAYYDKNGILQNTTNNSRTRAPGLAGLTVISMRKKCRHPDFPQIFQDGHGLSPTK